MVEMVRRAAGVIRDIVIGPWPDRETDGLLQCLVSDRACDPPTYLLHRGSKCLVEASVRLSPDERARVLVNLARYTTSDFISRHPRLSRDGGVIEEMWSADKHPLETLDVVAKMRVDVPTRMRLTRWFVGKFS